MQDRGKMKVTAYYAIFEDQRAGGGGGAKMEENFSARVFAQKLTAP